MNIDQALRILAGIMIIVSIILTKTVSQHFVWLTLFIGANLLQSGFTKWCPAMTVLKKIGFSNQSRNRSTPAT